MEPFAQYTFEVSRNKTLKGLKLPPVKYINSDVNLNEAQISQKEQNCILKFQHIPIPLLPASADN